MRLKKSSFPLLLLALASLSHGCSGVPLRPDGTPERQFCPEGALEKLRELDVIQGMLFWIQLDGRQGDSGPVVIEDGPIESYMENSLLLLPEGTRLYGHVWTAGPEVVIRYHEALFPDGTRIPFCGVAEEGGGGLVKQANSPRGVAILDDNFSGLRVVGAFPRASSRAVRQSDR